MESLIGLVNRIERAYMVLGDIGGGNSLLTLWEALPFVAVVNGQNFAKSSILESIVRRDFLFRGICCTRQTKDRRSMLSFFTRQRGDFQQQTSSSRQRNCKGEIITLYCH